MSQMSSKLGTVATTRARSRVEVLRARRGKEVTTGGRAMDQDGDIDIDLRKYLSVLRRRWPAIAAVAAVAVLTAAILSFLLPPVYEAKAVLLVARAPLQAGAAPDPMTPGVKIAAVLASDLPTATLPAFEQRVARLAGEPTRRLARTLSVRPVPNTNLLELRVREHTLQRAAQIANLWASGVAAGSHALFSTEAR